VNFKLINVMQHPGRLTLILEVNNTDASQRAVSAILERVGQTIEIETQKAKKRSNDANSYLWELCDRLAEVLHNTKDEIYKEMIRRVGHFEDATYYEDEHEDQKAFRGRLSRIGDDWDSRGLGWQTELVSYDDEFGSAILRHYWGSSSYNTREMSRLIDEAVYECSELGIETRAPEELASLLSAWEAHNG